EDDWSQLKDGYEQALSLSEESRCDEAIQILEQLESKMSNLDDRPTILLESALLMDPFDPILRLDGK
ncbi:MAG: hypothetical protein VB817_00860, partial [Pirellulaceae bacterium]